MGKIQNSTDDLEIKETIQKVRQQDEEIIKKRGKK